MDRYVIVVGVLDKVGSTNIPMCKSLMQMGIKVLPVNYRTILSNYNEEFLLKHLEFLCNTYSPEFVLFCKFSGVSSDIITKIGRKTKTFLFHMDPTPNVENQITHCEVLEHAKRANFSSCTDLMMVEWFNSCGANCFYIPQGIDPDVFRPVQPEEKYKADISFIGTKNQVRDMYLEYLTKKGLTVKAYGSGYSESEVYDTEFCKICASSRFILSIDSSSYSHKLYFSNRLPRLLACGTCVCHYNPTKDLNNVFKDGKCLMLFESTEELYDKIYNINEKDVWKIGLYGREKVVSCFTWQSIMQSIVGILGS